jgi:zinc/manganese transport system ATP-binding protein
MRLIPVLPYQSRIAGGASVHSPLDVTDILQVRGLDVAVRGRSVLRDVSFTVGVGEFVGMIGANGSGKTTLLRTILGELGPDAGEVRWPQGRSVGYVPQRVELDPLLPMRARDLVALGLDGSRIGLARRSRADREVVERMIADVGAEAVADQRVGTLSGGEQQRILIAHALVRRPAIVLLDEPLANLDPGSTQEIVDLLARLNVDQSVAVVLSAHEMNPLLPVMDRLVFVANGQVASGSIDEVVQPGVLSALYGHHVDVLKVHGREHHAVVVE